MTKTQIVVLLSITAILIFFFAYFFTSNSSNDVDYSKISLDSSTEIDCTGIWENNPLCKERNQSIRNLLELNSFLDGYEINHIKQISLDTVLQKKIEGNKLFQDEFYFKAGESYAEALELLKGFIGEERESFLSLKNQGISNYLQGDLKKAEEIFFLIEENINQESFLQYTQSIKLRPKINTLNAQALAHEKNQNFQAAFDVIDESLASDPINPESAKIKELISISYNNYQANNYIKDIYEFISTNQFKKAKDLLAKLIQVDPSNKALNEITLSLRQSEREYLITDFSSSLARSIAREDWSSAKDFVNKLNELDQNIVRRVDQEFLSDVIEFYKLYRHHSTDPFRLSSDNVLREANSNLKFGESLLRNEFQVLSNDLKKYRNLIEQFSKSITLNISSDKTALLEIKRFQSFKPFESLKLSVRPGNYIFEAKRSGKITKRSKIIISPDLENKELFISCKSNCVINEL